MGDIAVENYQKSVGKILDTWEIGRAHV